jgi:hypothetical protein
MEHWFLATGRLFCAGREVQKARQSRNQNQPVVLGRAMIQVRDIEPAKLNFSTLSFAESKLPVFWNHRILLIIATTLSQNLHHDNPFFILVKYRPM